MRHACPGDLSRALLAPLVALPLHIPFRDGLHRQEEPRYSGIQLRFTSSLIAVSIIPSCWQTYILAPIVGPSIWWNIGGVRGVAVFAIHLAGTDHPETAVSGPACSESAQTTWCASPCGSPPAIPRMYPACRAQDDRLDEFVEVSNSSFSSGPRRHRIPCGSNTSSLLWR